jgi:glycosyltransferase involved in cell wall biosynthesis
MEHLSIIVPTGDRAILLRRCLAQLERQTFRDFDVVVVDGGKRPSLTHIDHYALDLRYLRVEIGTTVGDRRNIAVENAKGDFIAHFDDDDFYHRDYLAELVAWWRTNQPIELGGMSQFYHYDVFRKRGWRTGLWDTGHPYGATFCYRKSTWRELGGFESFQRGEDQEFYLAVERAGGRTFALQRPDLYVYMRHGKNVSGPIEPVYHAQWTLATRAVMGDEIRFYDDLAELVQAQHIAEEGIQFHVPSNIRRFGRAEAFRNR